MALEEGPELPKTLAEALQLIGVDPAFEAQLRADQKIFDLPEGWEDFLRDAILADLSTFLYYKKHQIGSAFLLAGTAATSPEYREPSLDFFRRWSQIQKNLIEGGLSDHNIDDLSRRIDHDWHTILSAKTKSKEILEPLIHLTAADIRQLLKRKEPQAVITNLSDQVFEAASKIMAQMN